MRVVAAVAITFVAAVAAVVEAEGREVEWREVEGRAVEGGEGVELVAREERAIAATGMVFNVDFGTTTEMQLPLSVFLETDALILLPLRTLFPLLLNGKAKTAACTPPAF